MVSKDTARDDGANASDEEEDDDLAAEGTDGTTTGTGSKKAPSQGEKDNTTGTDGDDEAEEKSAKEMLALREQELAQAKKNVRTLSKRITEMEQTLTKLGVTGEKKPEDITQEVEQWKQRALRLQQENRRAQKVEAVREVLSTDKYRDYAQNVRYIVPMLDLDDDVDVDQDGRYDAEELKRAAREAVKQYAEDNPRPAQKRESAGGPGGEAGRRGALPPSEEEELARLEKLFKVPLR